MEQQILFSGISIPDFKIMMATLIKEAVEKRGQYVAPQPKEPKLILTRKEVAIMLGGVSNPTLIEWSKTGYLKSFHMGRKVRYRLADVQAFIDNRMKAAA